MIKFKKNKRHPYIDSIIYDIKEPTLHIRFARPTITISVMFQQYKGRSIDNPRNIIDGIAMSMNGTISGSSGQIQNIIPEKILENNHILKRIVEIWNRWHLNNNNAGTINQMAYLKEISNEYGLNETCDYDLECDLLNKAGLYIDKGYIYGTDWLFEPLPKNVYDEIVELFKSTA